MFMNSPGSRMMETNRLSWSWGWYSGTAGRCDSSIVIRVSSAAEMTCAGLRPRLVAITVNPFSMLREGTMVTRTHGLSELISALACSNAASALSAALPDCSLGVLALALDLFERRDGHHDAGITEDRQQHIRRPYDAFRLIPSRSRQSQGSDSDVRRLIVAVGPNAIRSSCRCICLRRLVGVDDEEGCEKSDGSCLPVRELPVAPAIQPAAAQTANTFEIVT